MSKHVKGKTIKVRQNVEEMVDADVTYISIVSSGANRVPFRKLAGADAQGAEQGDVEVLEIPGFRGVFATRKAARPAGLLAVAVNDGANLEAAVAVLKAAGLQTDVVQEAKNEEGDRLATLYIQGDGAIPLDGEGQITIQLADGVAALVQVDKAFEPFSGDTDFSKNLAAQSFFPSVRGAINAFDDTVFEIALSSDDKPTMVEMATKAAADFASAITSMVQAIPESVFKLDRVIKNLAGVTGEGSPPSGGAAEDQEGGEEIAERPSVNKADGLKAEASEAEVVDDKAVSADALKGLTQALKADVQKETGDALVAALAPLSAAIEALGTKVEDIAGRVKKAEGVLDTTVAAGDEGGDPVRKSAETPRVPALLDTGFAQLVLPKLTN